MDRRKALVSLPRNSNRIFVLRADYRRRSQSRMRGDYLFYEEKIETTPEEKEAKAARRYVAASTWKSAFSRLTCIAERGGRSTLSQRPPLPFAARTGPRSPTVSRSRRTRRTYTHVAGSRRASGTSWRTSRYAVYCRGHLGH